MLQQKQSRVEHPKACAPDKVAFSLQYDRILKKKNKPGNKSLVILELWNSARLSPLTKLLEGLADPQYSHPCVGGWSGNAFGLPSTDVRLQHSLASLSVQSVGRNSELHHRAAHLQDFWNCLLGFSLMCFFFFYIFIPMCQFFLKFLTNFVVQNSNETLFLVSCTQDCTKI